MNMTRSHRLITTILVLALTSLTFIGQTFAAPATERAEKQGRTAEQPLAAPGAQEQKGQEKPQASDEDLERFRADLIKFVQAYREVALAAAPKQAQKFNGIVEKLRKLTLKQLNVIRSGMPDFTVVGKTARKLHDSIAQAKLSRGGDAALSQGRVLQSNSPGFPTADYPSCGTTRVDDSVIDASDTALFVAEGVRDAASRACNEVIVILGEGGNGSLACIATDAIYLAAKVINYGLHYCNDKIDAAEQGATYSRLDHLHDDIEGSVANDNANALTITNAITSAQTAIVNNDNTNKTAIINNDNTNAANLTILINQALATIINNANANKEELKNLVLRTQIEADLATADNAVPLALYETPSTTCTPSLANPPTQCGYLNLVRTIVKETIANVAGPSTAAATALLAQGDAEKAAGKFKAAYLTYRKAYKTAAK